MPDTIDPNVTFLFTDVEGSAERRESSPEATRVLLARQATILQSAFEEEEGYAFKTTEDGFCVVFPGAPEATRAALAAGRALRAAGGRNDGLGVRMALYTGTVDTHDGTYYGAGRTGAARLLAAGNPGQILLGSPTAERVRDGLPAGAGLRDLGAQHLKGTDQEEHIYQLVAPDLPLTFPPLKTLDARNRMVGHRRQLLAAGTAILVVAAVAIWLGLQFQAESQREAAARALAASTQTAEQARAAQGARVAQVAALATQVAGHVTQDPQLSLLLAQEAVSMTLRAGEPADPVALSALHAALWHVPAAGARTGDEAPTLRGHTSAVVSPSYSPDGQRLLTGGQDGSARIWDAATGTESKVLRGHAAGLTSATWNQDGKKILTTSVDGLAKMWDAASGQETATLHGHTGAVFDGAWSSDDLFAVTAGDDAKAIVWKATPAGGTAEQVRILLGHSNRVIGVEYSPDAVNVLTAGQDGTVKIWDAGSGAEVLTLRGHEDAVNSAQYSPDSQSIVTASTDQTAKIWDATTGKERLTLRGHAGALSGAAYSPDGKLIVTASGDGTAKIWDATTGVERATLIGHTESVTGAAWSPDGRYVVTSSNDSTARQYLVRAEDLLALAASRTTRTLTEQERATYLAPLVIIGAATPAR
ncbi:MAG TPA: hypothetical protein VM536_00765 [Chloroflexia bacterium]|nr:hypothetical protein [Chloroflexia bacterium]